MSLNFPFRTPLVLGHRGASAHAPENTLAAFRLAMQSGADGIELDAHMVRGGEVMVLHDARVERTTNGSGRLADMTVAEAQRLEVDIRKEAHFAGERIPTLAQVFETLGDGAVYDLELKNFDAPGDGLEAHVAELVQRYHLEKRVFVSSFSPLAVARFKRLMPQVPASLLLLGGKAGRLEEMLFGGMRSLDLVGLFHGGLTPALVERMRRRGRGVLVWGPETPAEAGRAVKMGALCVVADDPALVRGGMDVV